MQQTGEPTVEEILASIRKVVAGSGPSDEAEAGPEPREPGDGSAAQAGDGVLELTEVLEHGGDGSRAQGGSRPLLAADNQAAVRDSLGALAALAVPGAAAQIVRSAESSAERITRELLRPMLADWLDRNLPPLVEKLVAAEIARIAGTGA